MSADKEDSSGRGMKRITSWMKSFAGFTTGVATIMTSAVAILGVFVHHQSAQLQQAHVTVSRQSRQIHQLQAQLTPAPAAQPSSDPASPPAAAPLGSIAHYLSDLTPTVNNAGASPGQQVMTNTAYPKTVSFYCDGGNGDQPDVAYDVAGNSSFVAEVGIPDNMSDVTDVAATIVFTNEAGRQIGQQVQVSLGRPLVVKFSIGDVTQLGITCSGRDVRSGQQVSSFQVALGGAGLS
jgi:hypothetical protein